MQSEELESFFISWANRIPQKSFSLTIDRNDIITTFSLDNSDENMKIIKKYMDLGIIKEFEIIDYEDDLYD